jgi:hypothetical protein
MPLHVGIVQSASLLTGGLEVWKAAKDVLVFVAAPLLLYIAYRRGLFQDKTFRLLAILVAAYALLHGLYLVLDTSDDTVTTIIASVYNTRLYLFLLLGYIVGSAKRGTIYLQYLVTATVLIATAVAIFGVLQYFLPSDLLTHVGYSVERGVKPLFFIDDKPDLPRVMSTLKDPNSFGAYLIVPLLITGYALVKRRVNDVLFVRPFRREVLAVMLMVQVAALLLTFSRGALLGSVIGLLTILFIATGGHLLRLLKQYWLVLVVCLVVCAGIFMASKDTYFVQNVIFHADESTIEADPNEKRITLYDQAVEEIIDTPEGHGPGTAGLVSIRNPQGGLLTENYYLQIAYEVGWLGVILFVALLCIVAWQLCRLAKKGDSLALVLFGSLVGYVFYSLLIHLWSNEAVALQWWLLAGAALALTLSPKTHSS